MNQINLTVPSDLIQIKKEEDKTIISIKDTSNIIFELDGDTIFKSNGKLFFVAEEEIGLITKKDMHLETLNDSKLFMNSRQCSLIKDDQESIRYRTKMSLEQNKQMIFAQEQENFITSLKDRVSIVEDKLKQIEKLEK